MTTSPRRRPAHSLSIPGRLARAQKVGLAVAVAGLATLAVGMALAPARALSICWSAPT